MRINPCLDWTKLEAEQDFKAVTVPYIATFGPHRPTLCGLDFSNTL
jgi:hypothetical protein